MSHTTMKCINTAYYCIMSYSSVFAEFVIVGFSSYENRFSGCEMFLYWISWAAVGIEFCFAVLAVASGLYYLAELVEEYSVIARKVINVMIWVSIIVHIGVWLFDGFPVLMILVGIVTQLMYSILLRTFPFISVSSPAFLLGCVLLVLHHYLTFQHFTEVLYSFQEVFAFFTLGLWMVPFAFFVSLSAGDNVLPTYSPGPLDHPGYGSTSSGVSGSRRSRRSGLLALFDWMATSITAQIPSRTSKSI
ncbi:protein TEX261-like isoform X2 [Dysidea avara]|uniref:protein TEX261-like isoform X2 n=1 Tax=Dysidea avara TaxID=196820 RepID=UPI0033244590